MLKGVKNSYSYATHLVDYLVRKGVYFRDAHEIISSLVKYCEKNNKYFYNLSINEFKSFSDNFEIDVLNILKQLFAYIYTYILI